MIIAVWIGPTKGRWLDKEESGCSQVYFNVNLNLEECKAACDRTEHCNAIMHSQTTGNLCFNFKCPYPLHPPPEDFQFDHHWVEYYRATSGTKLKYQFHNCSFYQDLKEVVNIHIAKLF